MHGPDIPYRISRPKRYTSNSITKYWKENARVLKYSKHIKNFELHNCKYLAVLQGYYDSNWISDTKDSKSTSGYDFTVRDVAVSWKSSKQTCLIRVQVESSSKGMYLKCIK